MMKLFLGSIPLKFLVDSRKNVNCVWNCRAAGYLGMTRSSSNLGFHLSLCCWWKRKKYMIRACSVVKIEDFSGDEDESKIEILTER